MNKTYNVSHIAMLQAGYEMCTNMAEFLPDFTKYNDGINDSFRTNLLSEIEGGFSMLGVDNASPVKETRQNISNATESFSAELSLFNTALKFAFRKDESVYNSIIQSLELNKFSKPYSKEAFMAISLNICESLGNYSDEMKNAKVPDDEISMIITLAQNYASAFKNQNSNASKQVSVSDEQQTTLNNINCELKAISEIAQAIYRRDRNKAKLFTFSVIAKKYTQTRKSKPAPVDPLVQTPLLPSDASTIENIVEPVNVHA
jgi:hypothetical protein